MINAITVTNHLGDSISIELAFPEKSGFVVHELSGLGPPKATINATELSTDDGSRYNSARISSRNIVLRLELLTPDGKTDADDVRLATYKYFPIKKKIKLTIYTDNRVCEIDGYVESNEPDIFTKKSMNVISIVCPNPYFYSVEPTSTLFFGVEPLFEFPFENASLTEDLIEFGSIKNETEQIIYYTGDAETGVIIYVNALGPASNLSIYNADTRTSMSILSEKLLAKTGSDIKDGDEIIISTVKGDKFVYLHRDGELINILNCISRDSDWFQLVRGDNLFAYTMDYGIENLQFRIENRTLYEGV